MMCRVLMLTMLCLTNAVCVYATPFSTKELRLSADAKTAALAQDLPVVGLDFDEQGNLWFATQNTLWRWHLETQLLFDYPIVKSKRGTALKQLIFAENWALVANDQALHAISIQQSQPLRIRSIAADSNTQSFALIHSNNRVFWVQSDTMIELRFDAANKPTVSAEIPIPRLNAEEKVAFDPIAQQLYAVADTKMRFFRLLSQERKFTPLSTKINGLRDITASSEGLLLASRYSIQILRGEHIFKTVAVASNRQLIRSDIKAKQHAFLFSDRSIEIYTPGSEAPATTQLAFAAGDKADLLRVSQDRHIALILDGAPRLFAPYTREVSRATEAKNHL